MVKFKQNIRHTLLTFFLTLIFFLLISFNFSGENLVNYAVGDIDIVVTDYDNTKYSKMIINQLKKIDGFNLTDSDPDKTSYGEFIIPKGFGDGLVYVNYDYIEPTFKIYQDSHIKSVITKEILAVYQEYIGIMYSVSNITYNNLKTLDLNISEIDTINNKNILKNSALLLSKDKTYHIIETIGIQSLDLKEYYILQFSIFTVFIISSFLLYEVSFEKKERILEKMLTSNKSILYYYFDTSISYIIAGSSLILIALLNLGFRPALFLTINLIAICTIYFLLGLLLSKLYENLYVISIVTVFSGIAGGLIFPVYYLPLRLSNFAYFTPNYWIFLGFSNISVALAVIAIELLTIGFLCLLEKHLRKTNLFF